MMEGADVLLLLHTYAPGAHAVVDLDEVLEDGVTFAQLRAKLYGVGSHGAATRDFLRGLASGAVRVCV